MKIFFFFFLIPAISMAGTLNPALECAPIESRGSPPTEVTVLKDAESQAVYLKYSFQDLQRLTLMKAVSGSELMGTEGSRLIFFEQFQDGTFQVSEMETKEFEVLLNLKLKCWYPVF